MGHGDVIFKITNGVATTPSGAWDTLGDGKYLYRPCGFDGSGTAMILERVYE